MLLILFAKNVLVVLLKTLALVCSSCEFPRFCALILETDIRAEDSEGVGLQNHTCIFGGEAGLQAEPA